MTKKATKKQPLQERSKQTVKTILEAATRVLTREGITGLNTNRVSEVAGVSVGSIYQFFKNKESILEELITLSLDQNLAEFMKILDAGPVKDGLRPFFEKLVETIFINFEKRGLITSTLLEHAPQLIGLKRFQKVDEKLIPLFIAKLTESGIQIRSKDPETAFFILLQTVRSVVSVTFARRSNPDTQARVKRELVDLCVRYLET